MMMINNTNNNLLPHCLRLRLKPGPNPQRPHSYYNSPARTSVFLLPLIAIVLPPFSSGFSEQITDNCFVPNYRQYLPKENTYWQ